MTVSRRQTVALLVIFEGLLILFAFAGYGTQTNVEQDQPIAFGAVLTAILGVGNALGLFTAVLTYAATLWIKHRRR